MTTIHGKNTGIALANRDVTRWCNEVSSDQTVETADASCFDEPKDAKVYVQGLRDTTFSYSGREQGTVDGLRPLQIEIEAIDEGAPFTVALERGFHAGRLAVMGAVLSTKLGLSAPIADVVSVSGDLQASGSTRTGKVITKKDPYTATTTGATVDCQFSGPSGALLHYHVVENSRNGNVTITVQDSANGTTWVDYHQIVVPTAQLASGRFDLPDSIDRYVRVVVSFAGTTGQTTIRVAVARKAS